MREAEADAEALDSLLQQAGAVCARIRQRMAEAGAVVGPHLGRAEHNIVPPDVNTVVLAQLARSGGPPFDALRTQMAAASLGEFIRAHAAMVLRYRPATITQQEEPDHG